MDHTAALERMSWVLDGLDGRPGWGRDADEMISPQLGALIPPQVVVRRLRHQSADYAPVKITEISSREHGAKVRLRNRHNNIDVINCTVEPAPPHRIISLRIDGLIPAGVAHRLPMDFAGYTPRFRSESASLVIMSGLPGSGKSTLAEALGRELRIPVFAVDWLLGSLTPFGGRRLDGFWDAGIEMLTSLALRQLMLGQSAILDHPTEDPHTRERWRSLADSAGADFKAIVCVCSDQHVHRARLEARERHIPGWRDAADWEDVQRRAAAFPPWGPDALRIDTSEPPAANLAAALAYVREPRPRPDQ